MRLRRLELTSYGAVSGSAFMIGPGLTVIHGPNESGKSTMSHAIGDVLWGLQARGHPYAFLVNPSQLRLTATVTESLDSTDELTLTVDSRGYRGSDDIAVTPWWRSGPVATRAAWTTALGLDLSGLRSGGRSVLEDGGDLASLLFRARTGVDVTRAVETLTAKAETAYKRHGGAKKVRVRELLATAELARSATAGVTSSASEVTRLQAESARLGALSQTANGRYRDHEISHGAAKEAQRAWAPAANLRAAREKQSELRAIGRVLDATALDAYARARREVTSLTGQLAVVDDELANLDLRVGELVVDDEALALASLVDDLQTRQKLEKSRVVKLTARRTKLAAVLERIRQVAASLAPRSWDDMGVNNSEALLAIATELLIPVDVADRIHRQARELLDIEEEIRIETVEVATALTRLTDLEPDVDDPTDRSGLRAARAVRDQAWDEVKRPWLSGGALPDDQTRARLAVDIDVSTRGADEASDHVAATAEGAGRIMEVNVQLAGRIAHLEKLRSQRDALAQAWAGVLAEAQVPSLLDPGAWEVRWGAVEELSVLLNEERELMSTVTMDEKAVAAYATDVLIVGGQLRISGSDTWIVLSDAVGLVRDTRTNQTTVNALREGRDKTTRKREGLKGKLVGQEAVIDTLLADDDLEEVVERSSEVAEERERAETSLEHVRHAAQMGTDLEALVTRLADLDAVDLAVQEVEARRTLGDAFQARDEARDAFLEAQASLSKAERQGDAATMHGREIEAAELLAAEVAEYVQTRVMITALTRLLAVEEPDHDTALLTHATVLVARLTKGRVTGLTVQDRAGERRLRIEAVGLEEGISSELSEGTADQVYLALRLAGIRQMQMRAVAEGISTLPVVLDDILVTHDDERTAIALDVLAEEALDQQILLMTHHSAVAEAARLTCATVVTLASPP